jgi:hypothetical protein
MSDARRSSKPAPATPERAKHLAPSLADDWREALSRWDAQARFEWAERVAIMIADAGMTEEAAERAAFVDVLKSRVQSL